VAYTVPSKGGESVTMTETLACTSFSTRQIWVPVTKGWQNISVLCAPSQGQVLGRNSVTSSTFTPRSFRAAKIFGKPWCSFQSLGHRINLQ